MFLVDQQPILIIVCCGRAGVLKYVAWVRETRKKQP